MQPCPTYAQTNYMPECSGQPQPLPMHDQQIHMSSQHHVAVQGMPPSQHAGQMLTHSAFNGYSVQSSPSPVPVHDEQGGYACPFPCPQQPINESHMQMVGQMNAGSFGPDGSPVMHGMASQHTVPITRADFQSQGCQVMDAMGMPRSGMVIQLNSAINEQRQNQMQQQWQPQTGAVEYNLPPPCPPPALPPSYSESSVQKLSNGMPSIGSVGHDIGKCKPCAFMYTKGCENGLNCEFCHICEPGEKKKRRKDKIENRRAMRQIRQALTGGLTSWWEGLRGGRKDNSPDLDED